MNYFPQMKTLNTSVLAVTLAVAPILTTQASANPIADTPVQLTEVALASDASERLEIASRLRTLSQQIAAASCTFGSGILTDEAGAALTQAKSDFDRYIVALRDGDPELGTLLAETDRRILHDLAKVEAEWDLIANAVLALLANPADIESVRFIDEHNLILLSLTDQLSSDIRGHYANPFEVSKRDSLMIELAGRQLMLTQKMAKDSCEIWSGFNVDAAKADLADTMSIFRASLEALRFGMPSMGIPEAPNEVIASDLDGLLSRWTEIEANLQAQLDGAELSDDQKAQVFHEFQVELADLKTLLSHYREFAERNL